MDTAARVKSDQQPDRPSAQRCADILDSQRGLSLKVQALKSLRVSSSDETVATIKTQMREAGATITSLRVKLEVIWRRLKVDDAEALIRTFTNAVQGRKLASPVGHDRRWWQLHRRCWYSKLVRC